MKNRFEHEINITKHFLSELETYLERDEAKQLEEMTEQYYILKQESEKQIKQLNEELSEARLKVSQMAMEKGKLLKKLDGVVITEERFDEAWKSILYAFSSSQTNNEAFYDLKKEFGFTEKNAEPDATGRP